MLSLSGLFFPVKESMKNGQMVALLLFQLRVYILDVQHVSITMVCLKMHAIIFKRYSRFSEALATFRGNLKTNKIML